ncbi:AMIN domain-containing protein [Cobetia sp. ICG0124]|uniref:AMIN domain-containing protein n=1 Tax=Cobetia sp. ICG0124 TaxID=2053669 RepID=UPI001F0CB42D|nr:AMIN domain-containing protein [Cobetia sp. ICG0124]
MTRLQRMSLLGLAAFGSLMASVAQAASTLQDLEFTSLGGDRMELKLDFAGGVPEVKGYRIETPPRITIDLMDTSSQLDKRRFELGLNGVEELVALEAGSRTRLVMKLSQTRPYVTRTEGNSLYVIVGEQGGPVAAWKSRRSLPSVVSISVGAVRGKGVSWSTSIAPMSSLV